MNKIILALTGILIAQGAHAAVNDFLPPAKLKEHTAGLKTVYGGVGMTNRLAHGNVEVVTPYGIGYGKVGVFTNGQDTGGQVGFRFPYHFTGTDQNGYYVGLYAGHTENAKIDNEQKQRLGVGVDLSYVLLSKERISTVSVGVGASEKLEGRYGAEFKSTPKLQFSYTLSFGIF